MNEIRKVRYLVAASLDGRIALSDGSFDFFEMAGDEHVPDFLESLKEFDTVLMGRKTYEVALKVGVKDPYPSLASYVFSRSLAMDINDRVKIVHDDPAIIVRELKQQAGKDIYLCGGAQLAATLLSANLIDEVVVKLNPLLIGVGIPLFDSLAAPALLELTSSKAYGNGVVLLTYRVNTVIR